MSFSPRPSSPQRQRRLSLTSTGRVPETLQTVLILANRGKEVHKPPPENVASKNFARRGGVFRNRSTMSLNASPVQTRRKSLTPIPVAAAPQTNHVSPHAYVTSVLKTRGYSTNESKALTTAYHNKPSPVQRASYGKLVVDAVRDGELDTLRELFELGLSPNACNQYGESIVHAACRLGRADSLRVMLEFDCQVSVCDDYGRTPLHDACWAHGPACFEVVELLLEQDPHLLFITDTRGSSPLSYLTRANWTEWTRFFMAKKDKFWPQRDLKVEGFKGEPERATLAPNSRPVLHGRSGLSFDLIEMVAEGSMDPSDASFRKFERESACELTCEESFSESSSDEMDYTELDDDECSECTFDEEEMAAILGSIGSMRPVAWSSRSNIEFKL